jgi:Kef-type K+ transport system membrane component KefB
MLKNKRVFFSPFFFFAAGLLTSLTILEFIRNYENHHWLILLPIILPLLGFIFGILSLIRAQSYWKLAAGVGLLLNLGLSLLIFLEFSFSYWQF